MEKKWIVVTGASGGLGQSTINTLLKEYNIIAIDKNSLSKEKKSHNEEIKEFNIDISIEENVEKVKEEISHFTNEIYAIINLVGIYQMDTILDGDTDVLKRIIDVNFFGAYNINKILFPLLVKKGKIINCTSELASYSAIPFNSYYTLSKVLLDNYSDTLRRELNYLDIQVIKIQSGSFATPLLSTANNNYENLFKKTKYYSNQLIKLKKMMDNELHKTNNPQKFGLLVSKIIHKNKPRLCYRINRSWKLRLMSSLPERMQDYLYKIIVK